MTKADFPAASLSVPLSRIIVRRRNARSSVWVELNTPF